MAPGFVEYNIKSAKFAQKKSSLVGNSASQYYTTRADKMYFVGNVKTEINVVDLTEVAVSIKKWNSIPITDALKNLKYASACLASTEKYLFVIGGQHQNCNTLKCSRALNTVQVFDF